MRIGLLGGTFNPIHNCHLQIAQEILQRFPLDEILFIPSGIPPHKVDPDIPSGLHRLEMTRVAVAPYPRFRVLDIEVVRKGPSYSVDTLHLLRSQLDGELFFILGVDAFLDIESWKEAERLPELCHLIVVSRPEFPFSSLRRIPLIGSVDPGPFKRVDEGQADRYSLRFPSSPCSSPPNALIYFKVQPCSISATDIRKRLHQGGSVRNLLPEAVRSYIIINNLYPSENT